ncbi:MAG: hypothetical protein ACI9DK_001730 [Vicingaceae bacterium]|jgi:hypothetical protein
MTIEDTIKYFDLVISDIENHSLFSILDILKNNKYSEILSKQKYSGMVFHSIVEFGVNNKYFNKEIKIPGTLGSLTSRGIKLKQLSKGHEAFEKHLEEKNKPQTNNINFIGGNNYGIQSSDSNFKNPTIKNNNALTNKTIVTTSKKDKWYTNPWLIVGVSLLLTAMFNTKRIMSFLNNFIDRI